MQRSTERLRTSPTSRETETEHWNLNKSGDWYDFTVTSDNFERRFAGRVETGKPGVSDPAMALHLQA